MKEITNYSFTGWKGATVHDVASTIDNSTLPAGHSERLIYNDKKRVQTWHANNATAYDLDGIPVTTFTLQPFTSKIVTGINLDCIQLYADATPPTVTAFTVPETGSITVTVTTFTASGAATGYLITESATPPALNQSGWTATAPVSYTATSEGSKTLYAWTRDAAGNVSASVSDNATFTGIPVDLGVTEIYTNVSSTTARRAMPATMTEDGLVKSVTFYHDGGIGNALVGIYADNGSGPSTLLAISASTALNTGASWNTINLITPVAVKSGVKIWMAVCPSIGGLHYNNSLPYRAQSGDISYALPTDFGTYTLATGGYSFRLTYWR
jgi:hypothetical protein